MDALSSLLQTSRQLLRIVWQRSQPVVKTIVESSVPVPAKKPTWTSFTLLAAVHIVSIAVLVRVVKQHVGPMFKVTPGAPIPAPTATTRYGLTEVQRRAIFQELVTNERNERRRAIEQNTWSGHAWSRDDDLGYVQRTRVRELALQYSVSASQVYLVLEEGIRAHWLGPDGQPLPATSAPISLRHE